tara:strand:- start:2375 stop:2824 length:450 start_codon:yes stop_codon:yes gene_type:complete
MVKPMEQHPDMTENRFQKHPLGKSFGKYMWHTIHIVALMWVPHGANAEYTNEDRRRVKNFYENLYIPCDECDKNYIKHLNENPLSPEVLKNNSTLFTWTVDLHNIVNKKLGKEIWSLDRAHEQFHKCDACDNKRKVRYNWEKMYTGMMV